ncbi:MAG: TetR/AcrR family transcriptional regulator [Candidatus Zixiibacteriota bacterium]
MSKIKQSPKLPPEKRRKQLLRAAYFLFLKKGYRMTTTDEIARKAGLTKGALYHHFKSKEDMLYILIREISDMMWESFISRLKKDGKPIDFVSAMLEHHDVVPRPKFEDIIDIYTQGLRIPRLKRMIAKQMQDGVQYFCEYVDRVYAGNKMNLKEVGIFLLALHYGLFWMKLFMPSLVNEKNQLRLIECCFDFDRLLMKKKKGVVTA